MTTNVLVRHIPDCPGVGLLRQRLAEAIAEGADLVVAFERVATVEEALSLVFCGSPTILIDGRDPFAAKGATPGLSCRLYATEHGVEPAPSLDQLLRALNSNPSA